MLLAQTFKTLEGAQRRAAFENAHSKTQMYVVVRCIGGVVDTDAFDKAKFARYEWRINRTKRG